jgi:lysozyme family protein
MDARARKMILSTIQLEVGSAKNGGWVNDPSDPGGVTQWGISQRFNPRYASKIRQGILTKEEAVDIYYTKYYRPIYRVDDLFEPFAYLLFDGRVHGSGRSLIRDLQSMTNLISGSRLAVDGIYGPQTFQALSRLSRTARADLLETLAITAPHQARKVAQATMNTQQRTGLKQYDYTKGFTARFTKRVAIAKSFA